MRYNLSDSYLITDVYDITFGRMMMRTTIDLDEQWVEAAQVLGTSGKSETVNRALSEVVAAHRRAQAVETFRSLHLDLDAETIDRAWL
jgi:Arc/MetJ family transcription regulator